MRGVAGIGGSRQSSFYFFFFQAEDGIRDYKVTGVQTCALPIFTAHGRAVVVARVIEHGETFAQAAAWANVSKSTVWEWVRRWRAASEPDRRSRSGERRGGEKGRTRGAAGHLKKKKINKSSRR